ncbi:hypothetical protein B0T16DRAFT_112751 [Cercophora newfieldiana]|uniref:Wax synthase domain-containing protein n=1 Tax=Cercophora newfieldiana TaxID=92897 RepID=A0AA39YAQ4_9PEZI|nr:hypothetical protein B0T16DRAFT_112751 [Cercophora newfieldiana]
MSSQRRTAAFLSVLSLLSTTAAALTTFQPICTAPTSTVSFVFIPNSRGTLEIIWGCVFAIFACTWTIHHPNLPRQRRKGRRGYGENLKCDLRDFWEATKLAFYTIIAPEAIVSVACSELLSAYWIRGEVERVAARKRAWHRSRSVVTPVTPVGPGSNPKALVESISLESSGAASSTATANSRPQTPVAQGGRKQFGNNEEQPSCDDDSWTIAEIQYANMGGFTTLVEGASPGKAGELYHLTAFEILNLWEEGRLLKSLPRIDEDELYDRSKCDLFLKTLAVVEILWSVIQIVTRLVRHLPVSPMELAVLAFSSCAVLIYSFYWMKPKNVYTTIHIPLASAELVPAADLATYRKHNEVHIVREFLLPPLACMKAQIHHIRPPGAPLSSVTSLRIPRSSHYANTLSRIAGYFAAALFGGIHAVAWKFPFPTMTEMLAWRCATVYTAIYGPIVFSQDFMLRKHRKVQKSVFCALTWLYVIARLVIIGEMVRTLFYLPKDSFLPTWVPNWSREIDV